LPKKGKVTKKSVPTQHDVDPSAPQPGWVQDDGGYVHVVEASAASRSELFVVSEPENRWHALKGAAIPHIPNFNRSGMSEADRRIVTTQILHSQVGFIQTLCAHKDTTFALRFIVDPAAHRIVPAVFAKCVANSPEVAVRAVRAAWRTVEGTFPRGYPLDAFKDEESFLSCFQPFGCDHVVEIRRPEGFVPSQNAYFVYPLAWGLNAMVNLCAALVRAEGRCVVSISLRPAQLLDEERQGINWMASRLREAADREFRGLSQSQRIVDEDARVAADIYAGTLRELSEPLVMKIHIAGPEEVPESLIAALGTEVTRPSELVVGDEELQTLQGRHLSRYYEAVRPADEGEVLVARREVYLFETYAWGATKAPQPLGRLRYLVSSQQANCAFRLPIAPTDRIDGLVVEPYTPFSRSHKATEPSQPVLGLGRYIHRGRLQKDGPSLPVRQLTRHALVAGFTGSGKTTTCMNLLTALWCGHRVPWLVLEPAKAEYRQLLSVPGLSENLRVFTLGNEGCSPFRLNPLEPVPGYPIQSHIDYLRTAFFASIPMWEPLPRIIERCLHECFRGKQYDERTPMEDPPTLSDLVELIEPVVRRLGYDAQIRDRAIGALRARLESLLMGNKGRMLSCPHGIPMDVLLEGPTILELRWITDEEERALLLALLLVRLYEHRVVEQDRRREGSVGRSGLRHVTLFEEAHQLLSGKPQTGGSSEETSASGRSLSVFANMLAEIRAFGEALIIADQIPGKLLPDVVKNTDLKIAHTLRAPDDRETMARATNLNEQQEAYIGHLPAGQAVVHYEGLEEPVLVQFPDLQAEHRFETELTDDQRIAGHMADFRSRHPEIFARRGECPACEDHAACPYREAVVSALQDKQLAQEVTACALATLAGGDGRRRMRFLLTERVRRRCRLPVEREELFAFLRCCCVQVARIVMRPHVEDARLNKNDLYELLDLFVRCHEPLISGGDDRAEDLSTLRARFSAPCQSMFLPSTGCDFCRRRCLFYHYVQVLLKDMRVRTDAIAALNDKTAAHQRFPATCLDAVAPIVGTDQAVAPHAAYCLAVLLLDDKGVQDKQSFHKIAKSFFVTQGTKS
jgi:hypothetical protein